MKMQSAKVKSVAC